jgi:hypothetical protein
MQELWIFLFAAFIMGIVRGTTICAVCCAPGMIPYIVAKRYNWRQSLRLGLIFSIPRIVVLTILGAGIGYISFNIVQYAWFQTIISQIGAFGYLLIGIILFAMGAYMFTTTVDQMADKSEGNHHCNPEKHGTKHNGPLVRIVNKIFGKKTSKSTKLFITWGIAMSVACVAETTILEGVLIGGMAGIVGTSQFNAAFIGGSSLFFVAIGTTLPVIVVVIIGGKLSERIKTAKTLDAVKTIGSMMMIMIGLVLVLMNISNLLSGN